ncbi:MAG: hypothetical protein A3E87_01375 [Gammaproteobacteria bacterium RIFCSPHIGHO2_12_FULL_35_23]|nr:MAG: hypothetical protein A3E87_01375 [Gammaproteobacteria bacterium RIFCSPHIGHO2_12_FULL_35_23]
MKRLFLILLLFSWQWVGASILSLNQLLQQVSIKTNIAQVNYTETHYLHFTDKPLLSQGTLYFRKPSYLAKQVASPQPMNFIINQQQLTIQNANKTYTVKLNQYPNLWIMSTTLQALLSNNPEFLSSYYNITIAGSANQWQLSLTPKSQINLNVNKIIISGKYNQISTIIIYFNNGDWVQQQFTKVAAS